MSNNKPIGIFDSGVGGLTVLREIKKQLPNESIIYFGDTSRAPYGEKSREEIIKINFEIVDFLLNQDVKMVIIGCNTSSALALEADKEMFPQIPIVDLISPGSGDAVRKCTNSKIGVIATTATVNSSAYKNKILSINPDKKVIEVACPKFVLLVESGVVEGQMVDIAVQEYIWPMIQLNIDTLIYGCTHYPFLHTSIKKFLGDEKNYIDPAESTIEEAKRILNLNNIANDQNVLGKVIYYTSGSQEKFEKLGEMFLGERIDNIKRHSFSSIKETISY